jgi:hypothetical protein
MASLLQQFRDIREAREGLESRLHSRYLGLVDVLKPLLPRWEKNPARASLDAARAFYAGDDAAWRADGPELIAQAQALEACQAHVALPDVLPYARDGAWWAQQIAAARHDARGRASGGDACRQRGLRCAAEALGLPADLLDRSHRHRDSVLGLPALICEGEPADLAAWVGTVLHDIDPDMARELAQDDPTLQSLRDDHDALLGCMAYLLFMIETLPCGFYAQLAGPGGIHVQTQLVRLVACGLLGARTALQQIHGVVECLQAFDRGGGSDPAFALAVQELAVHLDQFTTAMLELHELGALLGQVTARVGGWAVLLARIRSFFGR